MKIKAAARLIATAVHAASPGMKPELDKVMKSLTTVLGSDYKSEEHDGAEDVYWEFEAAPAPKRGGGGGGGGNGGAGDSVLFSIQFNSAKDAMQFEVEGDTLEYTSKFCKSASELLATIRQWARSKHSRVKVETALLAKLSRVASQA